MLKKLHIAGIVSALVSVAGILSDPHLLNILPENWSRGLTIAGIVLQGLTKGVQQGGTDLVPKEPGV